MVALLNKAGGSAAFGEWAKKHVKTRAGALLATFLLGVLIFVDDYFNCLTVGSVMMPVTDGHKISRAKLAYIIDATGSTHLYDRTDLFLGSSSIRYGGRGCVSPGIELFVRAIPYNYYSLLTIVFVVGMALMGIRLRSYGYMSVMPEKRVTCSLRENADQCGQCTEGFLREEKYASVDPCDRTDHLLSLV